jgi:deazaflavin-dependent oxidoreductase (nitroreductase family)
MSDSDAPQFLYLTTTGRKTGRLHQIEIWFVEYERTFYIVHEHGSRADWIANILHNPAVSFSVGSRDAEAIEGTGRLIDRTTEPDLSGAVVALMEAKYNWSDGRIVELKPNGVGSEAHGSI